MSCERCGAPTVEIVDDLGATDSGQFTERYECTNCGATGRITGDAAEPAHQWSRSGAVFNGGFN